MERLSLDLLHIVVGLLFLLMLQTCRCDDNSKLLSGMNQDPNFLRGLIDSLTLSERSIHPESGHSSDMSILPQQGNEHQDQSVVPVNLDNVDQTNSRPVSGIISVPLTSNYKEYNVNGANGRARLSKRLNRFYFQTRRSYQNNIANPSNSLNSDKYNLNKSSNEVMGLSDTITQPKLPQSNTYLKYLAANRNFKDKADLSDVSHLQGTLINDNRNAVNNDINFPLSQLKNLLINEPQPKSGMYQNSNNVEESLSPQKFKTYEDKRNHKTIPAYLLHPDKNKVTSKRKKSKQILVLINTDDLHHNQVTSIEDVNNIKEVLNPELENGNEVLRYDIKHLPQQDVVDQGELEQPQVNQYLRTTNNHEYANIINEQKIPNLKQPSVNNYGEQYLPLDNDYKHNKNIDNEVIQSLLETSDQNVKHHQGLGNNYEYALQQGSLNKKISDLNLPTNSKLINVVDSSNNLPNVNLDQNSFQPNWELISEILEKIDDRPTNPNEIYQLNSNTNGISKSDKKIPDHNNESVYERVETNTGGLNPKQEINKEQNLSNQRKNVDFNKYIDNESMRNYPNGLDEYVVFNTNENVNSSGLLSRSQHTTTEAMINSLPLETRKNLDIILEKLGIKPTTKWREEDYILLDNNTQLDNLNSSHVSQKSYLVNEIDDGFVIVIRDKNSNQTNTFSNESKEKVEEPEVIDERGHDSGRQEIEPNVLLEDPSVSDVFHRLSDNEKIYFQIAENLKTKPLESLKHNRKNINLNNIIKTSKINDFPEVTSKKETPLQNQKDVNINLSDLLKMLKSITEVPTTKENQLKNNEAENINVNNIINTSKGKGFPEIAAQKETPLQNQEDATINLHDLLKMLNSITEVPVQNKNQLENDEDETNVIDILKMVNSDDIPKVAAQKETPLQSQDENININDLLNTLKSVPEVPAQNQNLNDLSNQLLDLLKTSDKPKEQSYPLTDKDILDILTTNKTEQEPSESSKGLFNPVMLPKGRDYTLLEPNNILKHSLSDKPIYEMWSVIAPYRAKTLGYKPQIPEFMPQIPIQNSPFSLPAHEIMKPFFYGPSNNPFVKTILVPVQQDTLDRKENTVAGNVLKNMCKHLSSNSIQNINL